MALAEVDYLNGGGGNIEVFANPQMSANSQDGYVASIGNATLQDANSKEYKIFDKVYNDYCTLINTTAGSTYYQLECPIDVFPTCMIFRQNADGAHMTTGKVMASKDGTNFIEIIPTFNWVKTNSSQTPVLVSSNADYYKYFRYYPLTWGSYCSFSEWEICGVTR